ncbi:hypothetical protein [Neptunicella sp.]|uniref:hypothetical protein n=1 Tax=Neptunicella sp. TaxID=2125986 RepID=UPI003F694170
MSRLILLVFWISFEALCVPFDLEQSNPLFFAKEPLSRLDFTGSGGVKIYNAGDVLNLTFTVNFSLSPSSKYVRLDVENGVFNQSFPTSGLAVDPNYTTQLSAGGGLGDNYMIVEVKSPTMLSRDTRLTLESNAFIIKDISKPLSVTYRLYETASDAIYAGPYLTEIKTDMAQVISALGASFTQSFTHRVGFNSDFLRFNPTLRTPNVFSLGDASAQLASTGKFVGERLIIDNVLLASTALPITDFRELLAGVNTSNQSATISGDFSSIKAFLNEDDDCAGARYELGEYTSKNEFNVSIDTLVDYPVFCLSAERNDAPIKRSSYQLDLGLGFGTSELAELVYDAATIDLPYITNYNGYRQRIMLVNHTGYEVAYTSRFVTEQAVGDNFIVGDMASGVIPARTTLKLNAEDLVTIGAGGPSRISARIFIDAKAKDISAAVQILSPSSSEPPITQVLQVIEY